MARLQEYYRNTVAKNLLEKFKYSSAMEVPRLTKITLNMGVGEAIADKKILENAVADMTKISGQKPIITYARKSIANFKIRDGWPIGCKVTLRSDRMYEFLDRLINIAIPRIRDFRGLNGRSGQIAASWRLLQHGRKGTDYFPGNRLRQDRQVARNGYHVYHHRENG